ncbi:MAG: class I SAM-dependent methyltransferase [Ignavibacteria bacterium]|nr:class I SAM-dependent methyltransferase [Ignavibacteria bacterium]
MEKVLVKIRVSSDFKNNMKNKVKKNKEWYNAFFKTWDVVQPSFYSSEQTKKQAAFITKALKLKKGSKVLDVPCGNGRIGIELARKGCSVTGIDFNENMIKRAINESKKRKLEIDFHIGDMRKIPWKNRFNAVICWWGSYGYFDDKGNINYIKAVSSSLKKGGKFIIDTHIMETLLPQYEPKGWENFGDVKVIQDRRFDPVNSRIVVDWTFFKDGKEIIQTSSIQLYTYKELTKLLTKYGFGNFKPYGSYNIKDDVFFGKRLILVAEKN